MVAMSGQDALSYLYEEDPFKRSLMQRIANRSQQLRQEELDYLAGQIINDLSKAMK